MVAKSLPKLKEVVRLIKVGSLHAKGALPAENYQTYPIPVPGPCGLQVAFLYAVAEVVVAPRRSLAVRSPRYIGFVDAEAGRFEELRVFHAAEVGLGHLEEQLLGLCPGEDEWEAPEVLEREARLYRGYDALLGPFAAGLDPLPVEVKRAAADFAAVFMSLAEAPLMPFYDAVGRTFFRWIERAAR
jgi:hypothetical protein